jgi:hypothetical protein
VSAEASTGCSGSIFKRDDVQRDVFPGHGKLGSTNELDASVRCSGLRSREAAHLIVIGQREDVYATLGRALRRPPRAPEDHRNASSGSADRSAAPWCDRKGKGAGLRERSEDLDLRGSF